MSLDETVNVFLVYKKQLASKENVPAASQPVETGTTTKDANIGAAVSTREQNT